MSDASKAALKAAQERAIEAARAAAHEEAVRKRLAAECSAGNRASCDKLRQRTPVDVVTGGAVTDIVEGSRTRDILILGTLVLVGIILYKRSKRK